jgi:transcriptional regulator with XRE-family HTH domain
LQKCKSTGGFCREDIQVISQNNNRTFVLDLMPSMCYTVFTISAWRRIFIGIGGDMFMSNESVFLPAAVRDRIWDLLKERKVTQAELAARIGCSESSLSRFISGKTDKLGDENIIRIARAFDVSTDFLLGEVDEPDRKNYDISELGLSVEAARNLYTQKVNPKIVSHLLENPQFADTTYQIARYLDNELTSGFAAQNQLYSMVSSMLGTVPQAADEVKSLRTPIDQAELSSIQNSFMKAVRAVKKEAEAEMPPTRQLTAQAMKSIYAELTKGGQRLNRKITKEQIADAVAASVSHLPGVDTAYVRKLFLSMTGTAASDESDQLDQ